MPPGIPRGLGRHVEMFGPNVTEEATLGLFIAEMTYTPTIVLVKLSILALYWRIFNKSGSIKIPIYALTAAVVMWGIAVVCFSNPTVALPILRYTYTNDSDVPSCFLFYSNACLHEVSGTRQSQPLAMSTAKSFFSPSRSPTFSLMLLS